MTNNRITPQFTPDCTKTETRAGYSWLLMHMFGLPLLFTLLVMIAPDTDPLNLNVMYYGMSMVAVMTLFMKLLRREFDHLMDRVLRCMSAFFMGFFLWYALSMVMTGIMTLLGIEATPPNDDAADMMAQQGFNVVMVISCIFAPIVEEVLFRGILFQSIRKRSRLWAYAASLAVFGLYHTWQFAVVYLDPIYLLYSLQYIPITFALTWCYEYSGSLWTPIFLHAANNYLAMQVTQMM